MIKIVLTGGGTGGHIFPLITVAEGIKKKYQQDNLGGVDFLFIGPEGKLEKRIMNESKIPQKKILCGKFRRYFSFKYIIDIVKMPLGFFQSLWYLFRYMPDIVFSRGGYASVPVVMAAKVYRIPVVIHESDAIPCLANKFLSTFANRIAINFERSRKFFPANKIFPAGIPVRDDAINGDKQKAKELFNIKKEVKPVLLILGGSQGAKFINDQILIAIEKIISNFQVIHQTGENNFDYISKSIEKKGYKIGHSDYYPVGFINKELKDVLALADVVVSRAGATNIAELAANKKPAILVPINKSANDHQRANAFELTKAKAAITLEEKNFSENMLVHCLKDLVYKKELRKEISENIYQFYFPNSAEIIAEEILSLVKKD